jgi:hypothetical protein
MPQYQQPSDQWYAQQLAEIKNDVTALKKQGTQYVIDPNGVCRAIIGNLKTDQNGTETGLSGWGIAVFTSDGHWVTSSTDSGWIAPTLEHSWGHGAAEVGYRLQGNIVRLRGRLTGGASGTIAFTLPAGYRPSQQTYMPLIAGGANTGYAVIEPAGTVAVGFTVAEGSPSLDGVTFTID